MLLGVSYRTEESTVTTSVESIAIATRPQRDWARYFKATTTAVRAWYQRGQIGAASERDIGRATGAR